MESSGKARGAARDRAVIRQLALVAGPLIVAGCATLRQLSFERPGVELDSIEITALGLDGVRLNLWLDVFNPNEYEIRTTRIDATLDLESTHFGSAVLDDGVTLAPSEHTRVSIPAEFAWEGIGAGIRSLVKSGSVRYVLNATLHIRTSIGRRTVDVERRGEVPVTDLVP